VMERWIKEAEKGGAALHHKLQSGFTSTAVLDHNICWVDGLICSECLTTDELCSTLSIGKGSVMAVMAELAIARSTLIGCHK